MMGGLFTGQGVRTFFQPAEMYKELGLPPDNKIEGQESQGKKQVSPFVYFKAIYELGHGMNLLGLHHNRQYLAMTTLILMSVYMHVGFAVVVWKYGGSREKIRAQCLYAAVFAFWYWRCWHTPEGLAMLNTCG
ncbi:hypothetical protein BDW74DRAFT_146727 [Aspergillus multicolor]|uniref:DUF4267 domain-containing protein n=1 Tax=Aspergillus multicolor TaxID=41759 RepID=UPI003CCDFDB6